MKIKISLLTCLFCLSLIVSTSAQIPSTMNYQGSLKNLEDGTPIDASDVSMTFTIYDSLTDGMSLWTEDQTSIDIVDGIYSVTLGSTNPLDTLAFDVPYYLEVTIDGETFSSRLPLTSVPYARNAAGVEGLTIDDGQVGIGTEPAAALDVAGAIRFTSGTTPQEIQTQKPVLVGGSSWKDSGRLIFGSQGGWKFHFSTLTPADLSVNDVVTVRDDGRLLTEGSVGIHQSDPNGLLHVGDLTQDDVATLRFKNDSLSLKGGGGDTYPYLQIFDENGNRACYFGYGSKADKTLDFDMRDHHELIFRGYDDFVMFRDWDYGNSFEIGTDPDLPTFIRMKPTGGEGLAITNDGSTVGIFVHGTHGHVGINTTNPTHTLTVNGTIRTRGDVIVDMDEDNWPDYVFGKDYSLMSLDELGRYIQQHNHLPGVPTQQEVATDGAKLGEMQTTLLKKVEELTLHMIALQQENEQLKARLTVLEQQQSSVRATP